MEGRSRRRWRKPLVYNISVTHMKRKREKTLGRDWDCSTFSRRANGLFTRQSYPLEESAVLPE